jgi:MFS family permease
VRARVAAPRAGTGPAAGVPGPAPGSGPGPRAAPLDEGPEPPSPPPGIQAAATPRRPRRKLPLWTWSYVTFRFGDGVTSGLIPLATVLHYGEDLWVLALLMAAMNLAGVPATFLWGKAMDRGVRRRRVVVAGFGLAALGLALLAFLPPFPLFALGAVAYTVFGVATAPAASTMILQRVPRSRWGRTTAALSRRTGLSYLAGLLTSIVIAAPPAWWQGIGLESLAMSAYVGGPHFEGQFAVSAVMAASAAVLAVALVPAWQPPLPHETAFDPRLVQATQRRFERPVYFPGRLFSVPTWRGLVLGLRDPHRLWPLGYALTFMGSVCFFASYAGVLSKELLIPAGLVLLAQLPSNLVSPLSYPWAGRIGAAVGESRGVLRGSVLRTLALPLLALAVVLHAEGLPTYPLLLALHGLMGLSFALIQVNGPIILAEVHPGGRGQGVGTYHASVGLGTLLGSALAAAILAVADYRWSYAAAVVVAGAGAALLWAAHRSHRPAAPA